MSVEARTWDTGVPPSLARVQENRVLQQSKRLGLKGSEGQEGGAGAGPRRCAEGPGGPWPRWGLQTPTLF